LGFLNRAKISVQGKRIFINFAECINGFWKKNPHLFVDTGTKIVAVGQKLTNRSDVTKSKSNRSGLFD